MLKQLESKRTQECSVSDIENIFDDYSPFFSSLVFVDVSTRASSNEKINNKTLTKAKKAAKNAGAV